MPNRIIRDGINASPRINSLSIGAELLYRRLMSVVDDYGRFHGSPTTIRACCWPTHPDRFTDDQIRDWLMECSTTDKPLIKAYRASGSIYIEIQDFGQKIRAKSKFPEPDSYCEHSADILSAIRPQNVREMIAGSGQNVAPSRSRNRSSYANAETEASAKPTLAPTQKTDGIPDPGCQDFGVRYRQLYDRYPIPGFEREGLYEYSQIIAAAVTPDAIADALDKSLDDWKDHWKANPGCYTPCIEKFLKERWYLKLPAVRTAQQKRDRTLELIEEDDRRRGLTC